MKDQILSILTNTGIQILAVTGIFFVFGFLLSKIQYIINTQYHRTFGWKGILWTAWIGTPVHEISHVVFAWIFHHNIHHISLFQPNEQTGGLGHVEHSYERYSIWQRIGNFFIGASPMIAGPIVLTALLYIFIPDAKSIFTPLTNYSPDPVSIAKDFATTLSALFSASHMRMWQFWLFLYISFCVSCHIAPSKADLKGMFHGFAWLIFILLICNAIATLTDISLVGYLPMLYRYLHIFTSLFLYATLLSMVHLFLVTTIFTILRKG